MSFLVLIPFILILLGGLPHFGHHSYGSRPPGLAGVLDVARAVPARTTPADAWSTTKTRLALLTTVVSLTLMLGLWGSSMSGCAVFRAMGRSVEAVGAGAGEAVAGTGRAVSRAATETEQEIKGRR